MTYSLWANSSNANCTGRVKLEVEALEVEADEFRVSMVEFDRLNGCIEGLICHLWSASGLPNVRFKQASDVISPVC